MRPLATFFLALAGLLAVLPGTAKARENYAILIGAATYPSLHEDDWLIGPTNDVDLVRRFLTQNPDIRFQRENITILADGLDDASTPTLGAIRAAFADLTPRLEEGDFVYLHFSGHGSQAPALDPASELDGLDELFLPVDIGRWDDAVGAVENALADDEIGALVADLLVRGAHVWAVFDSCHSGTVTRGAPPTKGDDVRLRKVEPGALGIPGQAMEATSLRSLPTGTPQYDSPFDEAMEGQGSFVAFYAAQTNEQTPEKRLPRGMPGRRSQGVFTFTLFEALAAQPGATYRQIGQEVLRRYAVNNLARSTPMFEGDLDARVFSTEGIGMRVAQWPVQVEDGKVTLAAGRLHGLDPGAVLALMASPADMIEDALGQYEVIYSDTFSSHVRPVAQAGSSEIVPLEIPGGAHLRKTTGAFDFSLRVALPPSGAPEAAFTDKVVRLIQDDALTGPRIQFVPSGAEADLRLAFLANGDQPKSISILPATGLVSGAAFAAHPSVRTERQAVFEVAPLLADTLTRMARAQNLLKLGGAYQDNPGVELVLRTRSPTKPQLRDLEVVPVPTLKPFDEVHVLARNSSDAPLDINVLYLASDYSISHMFKGRLQPGDRLRQGLFYILEEGFGRDRVIIILTPAERHSAIEDLSFLEQDALTRNRGSQTSFGRILTEAGFGNATRAAAPLGGSSDAGPSPAIITFDLDTRPAIGD